MTYTQEFQVNGVIFTTTVFLDKLSSYNPHVVLTKEKETDIWVTRTETNSKELTDCIKEHRAEAEKFSSEPEVEYILTALGFVKKEKSLETKAACSTEEKKTVFKNEDELSKFWKEFVEQYKKDLEKICKQHIETQKDLDDKGKAF